MAIDEALVARCVALVRYVAQASAGLPAGYWVTIGGKTTDEARAIVALLPEPIDPDFTEASLIAKQFSWPVYKKACGDSWEGSGHNLALAAIKRGRELAAQESSK